MVHGSQKHSEKVVSRTTQTTNTIVAYRNCLIKPIDLIQVLRPGSIRRR